MWSELPEKQLLSSLGSRIRDHRKNRRMKQTQLAEKAGIGLMTLKRLEKTGQANLDNFLRVLRALRLLDRLEDVMDVPTSSPLDQLRESERR